MLAPPDEEYLRGKGLTFDVVIDQGLICVVVQNYELPTGYDRPGADLLLRLPPGFPDAQPDMFWCDPPVRIASSGSFPQAADLMESYLGRTWQRFSRHLGSGVWKPGVDNLGSYLALIRSELERSVRP
jgi:hypothetical protein